MRILFVAMPNSVHAARWINQVVDQGWDVALFPIYRASLHPQFKGITYFSSNPYRSSNKNTSVRLRRWPSLAFYLDIISHRLFGKRADIYKEKALAWAIRVYKPDILHSLELQHSGYLTLEVKRKFGKTFPTWALSLWGSDLYLFGRLCEHRKLIKKTLENCDYIKGVCPRDEVLAKKMGFNGKFLPRIPSPGGLDFSLIKSLRETGKTSDREVVILKGYQSWAGRALVGLRALARCSEMLHGYEILIHSATPDVKIAAELFSQETNVNVRIIPQISYKEILQLYGQARLYLGLSISDGLPNSMLEAMVMGSFPIQSNTACTEEWIEDGKNGLIVPPEDPETIAKAIRKALQSDSLVDSAAVINAQIIYKRLDASKIKPKVVQMYQDILLEA